MRSARSSGPSASSPTCRCARWPTSPTCRTRTSASSSGACTSRPSGCSSRSPGAQRLGRDAAHARRHRRRPLRARPTLPDTESRHPRATPRLSPTTRSRRCSRCTAATCRPTPPPALPRDPSARTYPPGASAIGGCSHFPSAVGAVAARPPARPAIRPSRSTTCRGARSRRPATTSRSRGSSSLVHSRTFGPGGLTMPAMWPPDVITKRIGALEQLRGAVRRLPRHDVVVDRRRRCSASVADLRDHQPLAQRGVLVVGERVLEVGLAEELAVGLARAGWCCRRSTPAGRTRAASPPAASSSTT